MHSNGLHTLGNRVTAHVFGNLPRMLERENRPAKGILKRNDPRRREMDYRILATPVDPGEKSKERTHYSHQRLCSS